MKTTLDIDDRLLREAKKRAAERGTTLTRIVEDALRRALELRQAKKPFRVKWVTAKSPMLRGVDLTSRESLYDLMEGGE